MQSWNMFRKKGPWQNIQISELHSTKGFHFIPKCTPIFSVCMELLFFSDPAGERIVLPRFLGSTLSIWEEEKRDIGTFGARQRIVRPIMYYYYYYLLLFIITKDHHALNMKSQSMSVAQTIQKKKNTEKWITLTNCFALDCCNVFSIVCSNVA